MITVTLKGADNGNMVDFEGTALQMPSVNFKATLTRIPDYTRLECLLLSKKIAQGSDMGGTDGNALSRGNAQS